MRPLRKLLTQVERELPMMLSDEDRWQDLVVTYHPPLVERLWTQYDDEHRVLLHRIHHVDEEHGDPLWHNHPWPSIVKIIQGSYSMMVGVWHRGEQEPDPSIHFELNEGCIYEMPDQFSWHDVNPIGGTSLSLMIIARPFETMHMVPAVEPEGPQPRMDAAQRAENFLTWRSALELQVMLDMMKGR